MPDIELTSADLEVLSPFIAEDDRQDKLHDLLETIREQIRLEIAPEHRPTGLMTNIQNAVYAMRGRTRLMNDVRVTALARAGLDARKAEEWLPMPEDPDTSAAPFDKQPVLIAVPNKDRTAYIVGEAYFDPENYEGGDWWWAGTGWGDYHAGPVSEINHWPPEFWRPLPATPAIRALPLTGDKP